VLAARVERGAAAAAETWRRRLHVELPHGPPTPSSGEPSRAIERRPHPASSSPQATMQLRSILVALALGATSAFMRPASVSRVTARFSVEDKLKEIVAEQLGVEQSSITPEASFASDLGADSLDVVEMVMKIEEEFNVELPDERAEEVQNLSDAVRVVTELTA